VLPARVVRVGFDDAPSRSLAGLHRFVEFALDK